MEESFTRSLYIGRDKTQEVLRRRKAVEMDLQARREAKIREHNEKIERVAQQKELQLREKMRKYHEKELQKQKAVLDRRCAKLEEDKAKKAEKLQKAHSLSSRTAQIKPKKTVYAFGSSTPRELNYLNVPKMIYINNNIKDYPYLFQNSFSNSFKTINLNRSNTAVHNRTPSRLGTQASEPGFNGIMTSSVYSRLQSNKANEKLQSTMSSRNTLASEKNSNNKLSIAKLKNKKMALEEVEKRTTPSIMTQSLYEPKPFKALTPQRNLPKAQTKMSNQVTKSTNVLKTPPKPTLTRDENVHKETGNNAIKPLKAINNNDEIKKVVKKSEREELNNLPNNLLNNQSPLKKIDKNTDFNNSFTKSEDKNDSGISTKTFNSPQNNATVKNNNNKIIESTIELTNKKNFDANNEQDKNQQSDKNLTFNNTNDLLNSPKEEWDSGLESNIVLDGDSSITQEKEANKNFLLHADKNTNNNEDDNSKSNVNKTPLKSIKIPTVSLEDAEKERETRRQKLNEILQKTRTSNVSSTDNNNLSSTDQNNKNSLKNLSSIDANALAQDLLAQRRQKMQKNLTSTVQSNNESFEQKKNVPSLGNDLANAGFFDANFQPPNSLLIQNNGEFVNEESINPNYFYKQNVLAQMPSEVLTEEEIMKQHKETQDFKSTINV